MLFFLLVAKVTIFAEFMTIAFPFSIAKCDLFHDQYSRESTIVLPEEYCNPLMRVLLLLGKLLRIKRIVIQVMQVMLTTLILGEYCSKPNYFKTAFDTWRSTS